MNNLLNLIIILCMISITFFWCNRTYYETPSKEVIIYYDTVTVENIVQVYDCDTVKEKMNEHLNNDIQQEISKSLKILKSAQTGGLFVEILSYILFTILNATFIIIVFIGSFELFKKYFD